MGVAEEAKQSGTRGWERMRMWREDHDGTQEVAPSALIPMLVKAIQELEARIAVLEG